MEVASFDVFTQYQTTERELIKSREGSEYVRKAIAQVETDKILEQLASLPVNWDSYGSEQPSAASLAAASDIARAFVDFGLIPDAIAPSAEGGVAICFVRNEKYADIECFNSGEILAVRYSSHDDPKAWPLQPNKVATDTAIRDFSTYLSA
jgi:hypothetical protein